MATSCIRTAARDAAGPVRSLASSSALHSGGDRQHARTRDAQLHRAPKIASRVSLQVHAWSKHLTWPENSGDRGEKKLCELPAWSAGARGCSPPASEQPSAEARPAARGVRAPRSPAVRANLGAHRGHGRALTWHSLLSVQVVAVFTWVFKQVSGRENEGGKKRKRERKRKKKIQLCKWAPDWEARVGSDAATVRVLGAAPGRADLWGRVTATPGPAAGASRS